MFKLRNWYQLQHQPEDKQEMYPGWVHLISSALKQKLKSSSIIITHTYSTFDSDPDFDGPTGSILCLMVAALRSMFKILFFDCIKILFYLCLVWTFHCHNFYKIKLKEKKKKEADFIKKAHASAILFLELTVELVGMSVGETDALEFDCIKINRGLGLFRVNIYRWLIV